MRYDKLAAIAGALIAISSAPAHADILDANACNAPMQPCRYRGGPGRCVSTTCTRTLDAQSMCYPCFYCVAIIEEDAEAGLEGGGLADVYIPSCNLPDARPDSDGDAEAGGGGGFDGDSETGGSGGADSEAGGGGGAGADVEAGGSGGVDGDGATDPRADSTGKETGSDGESDTSTGGAGGRGGTAGDAGARDAAGGGGATGGTGGAAGVGAAKGDSSEGCSCHLAQSADSHRLLLGSLAMVGALLFRRRRIP